MSNDVSNSNNNNNNNCDEEGEEQKEEEEVIWLPWETPKERLPGELLLCVQRAQQGDRLQVSDMLSNVPLFEGLKARAEENNHLADGKLAGDKFLKDLQQRLLHMARVHSLLYLGATNGE